MQVQTHRRSMPLDPAVGSATPHVGGARYAGGTYEVTSAVRGGTTHRAGVYGGTARAGGAGVYGGAGGYGGAGVYGAPAGQSYGGDGYETGGYDDGYGQEPDDYEDAGGGGGGRRGGGTGRKGGNGGGKQAKKRRKDPLWAKLTMAFGALLMLASGGAIVSTKMLIGRYTEDISQQTLLDTSAQGNKGGEGKSLDGPINMLLLGVDERSRNPGDVRSDTIIVLHIPATHDQAYLVSVPRDTFVDVPAFKPSGYGGGQSKLTDAFYFGSRNGAGRAGGAQLVSKIINKMTGIEFDGAAIIDFGGFKRVIDALGGVTMCVDTQVTSAHMRLVDGKPMWLAESRQHSDSKPVVHKEGCRPMEGWEALDYSRQRYGLPKGDYDRQRHQQQLIKAIAKKAMSGGVITNPSKLDKVMKAAGKAFILDTGGVEIADFIFTLKGVAANDLVLVRTNAGTFNSTKVGDASTENLSDESLEMFSAVADGTLADWLVQHPDFVNKEK